MKEHKGNMENREYKKDGAVLSHFAEFLVFLVFLVSLVFLAL
jgi:hypothetical protein